MTYFTETLSPAVVHDNVTYSYAVKRGSDQHRVALCSEWGTCAAISAFLNASENVPKA